MSNLSVRMKKKTIEELDKIAKLLKLDRATIVRRIVAEGIEKQKIEVAIKLYQKGETLERAANLTEASVWDLIDEIKRRGIVSEFDIEEEKDTYIKALAKDNEDLAKKIHNIKI